MTIVDCDMPMTTDSPLVLLQVVLLLLLPQCWYDEGEYEDLMVHW